MPLAQEIDELVPAGNLLNFRKIPALRKTGPCMSRSLTPSVSWLRTAFSCARSSPERNSCRDRRPWFQQGAFHLFCSTRGTRDDQGESVRGLPPDTTCDHSAPPLPIKVEPRDSRRRTLSAMNSASFSASFHLVVRRVGSKSWARITARRTGMGCSRIQSRKRVSPRTFHSACMSGNGSRVGFFATGTFFIVFFVGRSDSSLSILLANSGFCADSSASKSTKPRSSAINVFSFRTVA